MMTNETISGKAIVGRKFPPIEGARLAEHIVAREVADLEELEIDLTGLPPSLLISAFFNGFLRKVSELAPSRLDAARHIEWKLDHEFQEANVRKWVAEFRPEAI